jgi:hypothetical protein
MFLRIGRRTRFPVPTPYRTRNREPPHVAVRRCTRVSERARAVGRLGAGPLLTGSLLLLATEPLVDQGQDHGGEPLELLSVVDNLACHPVLGLQSLDDRTLQGGAIVSQPELLHRVRGGPKRQIIVLGERAAGAAGGRLDPLRSGAGSIGGEGCPAPGTAMEVPLPDDPLARGRVSARRPRPVPPRADPGAAGEHELADSGRAGGFLSPWHEPRVPGELGHEPG